MSGSKTCDLKNKASDSALLYIEFLKDTLRGEDPKLIMVIVSKDEYGRIRGVIRRSTSEKTFYPEFLKRYLNRDVNGQRIFFDEVRWCSVNEFCVLLKELGIFGTQQDSE